MKSWKKLLKIFPAKGSSLKQNVSNQKNHEVIEAIVEIEQTKPKVDDIKTKILGDLLTHLRVNKLMSTLMICRQIENFEINDNVAVIFATNDEISSLWQNEKHKTELDKFFSGKGLSFKVEMPKKVIDPTEKLREMFGEKLKIQ